MVVSDTWNMIDGLPFFLVTSEFGQVWENMKI